IALWSRRARALACADLWLAAAGFRVGPARDISLGRLTAARDWHPREDCVQYFAFRLPGEGPLAGIRAGRFRLQPAPQRRDRLAGTTHSGEIPEHTRPLDWADCDRGIPGRSSPAAPLSRTALIYLHT